MAQDYMGNYTSSPNADVLQLLSAQNQADADRAARFAGSGGSYANIDEGPSIEAMMRRLAEARTAQERQDALQSINQHLTNNQELRTRIILGAHEAAQKEGSASRLMSQEAGIQSQQMAQRYGLEGAQAERNAMIQREAMEHMAKQMMLMQQQQNIYDLQLAQADREAMAPAMKLAEDTARRRMEFQGQQLAANAAYAVKDDNLRRAMLSRHAELVGQRDALQTYRGHIKEALGAGLANREKEWLTNPNLGGMPLRSAGGATWQWVAGAADWLGELGTGDVYSDVQLNRFLSGGEHATLGQPVGTLEVDSRGNWVPRTIKAEDFEKTRGLQALAAASQMPGFTQTALAGAHGYGNEQLVELVRRGGEGKKAANKFFTDYLTHHVVGSLTSGGIPIDVGTATPAVQKLMRTLIELRESNAPVEEVRTRVQNALKEAAPQIYGPNLGENAIPHLIDGLDQTFETLNLSSGETAKAIWDANHTVNPEAIQNAAATVARELTGSLRHVVKMGVRGVYFDSNNLNESLGLIDQVYNPEKKLWEPGLLPGADTEQGRMLELVLGGKVGQFRKEWAEADVAKRTKDAALNEAERVGETNAQIELMKLIPEMAKATGRRKLDIAQRLFELMGSGSNLSISPDMLERLAAPRGEPLPPKSLRPVP